MTPFCWLPEHVAKIGSRGYSTAPPFAKGDVPDVLPGYDVWDTWPVLNEDGSLASFNEGVLAVALTAPKANDPERRHDVARMRLFHVVDRTFRDLGPVLPTSLSPGSREWAGSTVLSPSGDRLAMFFTVTGRQAEAAISYDQRLFETDARVDLSSEAATLSDWRTPVESVCSDGLLYESDTAGGGAIGTIKAFRDPFFFRSPGGEDYLLFTGSDPHIASAWNGLVGAARRENGLWRLQPPLVRAPDLNNELERPHIITHGGYLYLFWSTQRTVFNTSGPTGPTGLYGVVASHWGAPWHPLNETGLVFANPDDAPLQAYSFQVLPDLSVWSFADMPETRELPADRPGRRAAFVGGPAPVLQLSLQGESASLLAI